MMRQILFLIAVLGAGKALAQDRDGRACNRNQLTVDVPVFAAIHPNHDTVSNTVAQAMKDPAWSTDWLEPCGNDAQPDVEMEDLMAAVPIPWKQGCHQNACRRHQLIRFLCKKGNGEYPRAIKKDHTCQAISAVRKLFVDADRSYSRPLSLYVTRDCDLRPQAPPWQEKFVGKAASAEVPTRVVVLDNPKSDHAKQVQAVINTYVKPTFWAPPAPGFENDIGQNGSPTSGLARALANVIKAAHTGIPKADPLVVNISLGWPPEFSRPWKIEGCREVESPAGEAVRYALAILSARNNTVILAAAGNRQLPIPTSVYQGENGECVPGRCESFFPAAWATYDTNVWWEKRSRRLLQSVGQVGFEGAPGTGALLGPTFYAPGGRVELADGSLLPSGTSFATAGASALAAQALNGGLADLDGNQRVDGADFVLAHTCQSVAYPDEATEAWFPQGGLRWLRWQGKNGPCPPGMAVPHPAQAKEKDTLVACDGDTCPEDEPALPFPFLPDQYHRVLNVSPQPITPICPETNCKATVDTSDYATVDLVVKLATGLNAPSTPPFVKNNTARLKLFKGTALVTSWNLYNSGWVGGTEYPINNLVIPTGHRTASDWQGGQYTFKFEATSVEGTQQTSYYNLDPVSLVLAP